MSYLDIFFIFFIFFLFFGSEKAYMELDTYYLPRTSSNPIVIRTELVFSCWKSSLPFLRGKTWISHHGGRPLSARKLKGHDGNRGKMSRQKVLVYITILDRPN